MISRLPEVGDHSQVEEPSESGLGQQVEEYDSEQSPEVSSSQEEDTDVIILSPSSVNGPCCSCGAAVQLTVIATFDAVTVLETLLESTRLNLLCTPCVEDLKRVQDERDS